MKPASQPPPSLERLLARLQGLESPVLQVWGWPGSGRRALLEALLAEVGEGGSRALALAEVESEERLTRSLQDPDIAAARWLVAWSLPSSAAAAACRLLRPGQRLVVTGRRRLEEAPLPVSVLAPDELLLSAEEIAELWRRVVGRAPAGQTVETLSRLTDGWYLPLRLTAEAVAAGGLEELSAEAILDLPALAGFLRREVVDSLPEELAAALLRLARGAELGVEPASIRSALDAHGWLLPVPGGARLPELLAHWLRRQGPRGSESQPEGEALEAAPVSREGPAIHVALLGNPRVSVASRSTAEQDLAAGPELRWPLRRALKVLAFLACSPDFEASRDDLVEAIWPEVDEEKIEKNFHPTLSHLRRTLAAAWRRQVGVEPPSLLVYVNGTYRLGRELRWRLDIVELAQGIEAGRKRRQAGEVEAALALWERTARLYRGPFLQGVYDAWVEPHRDRYQHVYLDLLREMGDLYAELERWTDALDAYRRVLIEDPLREPIHTALMGVYAKQGRRDLVRRQYDRLAALLAEELGVEPLPETTGEYHRLMA